MQQRNRKHRVDCTAQLWCSSMPVQCSCCRGHRSRRERTCIDCHGKALPSCRPQRCMIVAGLTSARGLDPTRPIWTRFRKRPIGQGSWTLCRYCMKGNLFTFFLARALAQQRKAFHLSPGDLHRFTLVAEIISHYAGGPWTVDLVVFYSQLHKKFLPYSWEGEPPQGELQWIVTV